MSLIIFDTS